MEETGARMAARLLREQTLTLEDRQLLTTVLLDRLGALPIRARITVDSTGRILVDNKALTTAAAARLRKAARGLLNNFARNFVQQTIEFMAVKQAVHSNTSDAQALFAKAIFWQHAEEQELYRLLAGNEMGSE